MILTTFTIIVLVGAFAAGLLGSLTGLGGGFVIIPMLTLIFQIDIRYAIGSSLVAVIATSSGSAAAYVKEGITNIRLGMFLEIATTTGAVAGAFLAVYIPTNIIAVIFGIILLFSAILNLRHKETLIGSSNGSSILARHLRLNGDYPAAEGKVAYTVRHVSGGYLMMTLAGILSGLLGVGSGALKVLAMDQVMKIPFKVSTTTSNFMIGVTAAASAVIYFQRGYIDPGLSMPVVIGVLSGAFVGSRLLVQSEMKWLKPLFTAILFLLAIEMIHNGWFNMI